MRDPRIDPEVGDIVNGWEIRRITWADDRSGFVALVSMASADGDAAGQGYVSEWDWAGHVGGVSVEAAVDAVFARKNWREIAVAPIE
jgi:hypothetical protein